MEKWRLYQGAYTPKIFLESISQGDFTKPRILGYFFEEFSKKIMQWESPNETFSHFTLDV